VARRRVIRAEVTLDGRALKTRAIQISVGNGRFYGGGMAIAADARIDDGTLDLVLVTPQTMWQLISRLPLFRWGRHDLNDNVQHLQSSAIDLSTTTPLPINTDGEMTTRTPVAFRLVPQAIEVFVPAP
jgi:diacylglycerol kinase family enzyme